MPLIRPKPRIPVIVRHTQQRDAEKHSVQCEFYKAPIPGAHGAEMLYLRVVPVPQAGLQEIQIKLDDLQELLEALDDDTT